MSTPKISIITPVYKAQKTIRRCLESILKQTFSNWELLLVDDGSPDDSGHICDEYSTQDSRIRTIHQNNKGVSSARQVGLDAAIGEYVIHVDPDDWGEPKMLEDLYIKAVEENADMVICDWFVEVGGIQEYRHQQPSSMQASVVLENIFDGTLHGSCCNKLVKRACISLYNARFPDGINYCEDVCFNVQLLKHNIKIAYLDNAYYHYVQSSSSATNHYTIESLESQKKFVQFLETCLSEQSFPVVSSKELVKKLAFRNAILSDEDFKNLYPEIKSSHDRKWIVALMYNLAFTDRLFIAKILRKVYLITHGKK